MPKPATQPFGYRRDGGVDLRHLPRTVERPLMGHRAEGLAWQRLHSEAGGDRHQGKPPTLEVDVGLRGRARLEAYVHEALHLSCPWMFEPVVLKVGRYIARILWRAGYRHPDEE